MKLECVRIKENQYKIDIWRGILIGAVCGIPSLVVLVLEVVKFTR
jgi:hypothetical protein